MKGDSKVIEYLNIALKNELTAINQYFLHYRLLEHWGVQHLAKFEYGESIDEMKHADWLAARIAARAQAIVDAGMAEVAALLARRNVPANAPILRAIGVPELTRHLRGEIDRAEMLALLDGATRRYAKRQYTWFRHQPPAAWPRWEAPLDDVAAVADRVASALQPP